MAFDKIAKPADPDFGPDSPEESEEDICPDCDLPVSECECDQDEEDEDEEEDEEDEDE